MEKAELLHLARAKLDEVHTLLADAEERELAGLAGLLGRTLAQPDLGQNHGKRRVRRGSLRSGRNGSNV